MVVFSIWVLSHRSIELSYVVILSCYIRPLFSPVNTEVMISSMDSLQLSDDTPINVTVCASLPSVMALDSSLTVTVELEIGMPDTGMMNH